MEYQSIIVTAMPVLRSFSKGISPLIAAVLLVAFTMAIAGIMAAWATTFAQGRLTEAGCALSLRILDLKFSNGNVSVRLINENNNLNLTDLKASLVYDGAPAKNMENLLLRGYNSEADPLAPSERQTIVINTTDNVTEPTKIEIVAGNCPKVPASGKFPDFR